ncbi:GNAT family N-acetyltransferase [Streptomyces sp. NPDC049954]|uniref:GNAT family N-acetyltransferase n=1 Tax=Streptomyces sp. NPDC049954 TaxID=3155779 RepID=UPI00342F46D3
MTHVHLATPTEALGNTGAPVAGLAAGGRARWTTEWCTRPETFALLAPEWRRLHRACPAATPFQSHAWLHSWWRSYGSGRGPRVLLVRRAGELVAAAPLMRAPGPLPALVLLGGPVSDFGDVLIDAAHQAPAARALAAALHRAARTAVLDLREVRPGAAVESLLAHWTGPLARRADSVCLELPAVAMDEQLARLPRSTAQRVRAKLRKTDALGVESRAVPAEEVPAAVRALLDLHRLQWQGRRVTPEHLRPRFRDHLVRAVTAMVRSGDAAVTEYRLDGRVVAADLTLLSPSLAGGYLYGADPGLRSRKADVTSMLLRTCARYAASDGRTTLSLLRGTEPYKEHWRPERVVNSRLLLARRRTAPLLWLRTAQADARSRAARWAKARAARAARAAEREGRPGA